MTLLDMLRARGFVEQVTEEDRLKVSLREGGKQTIYIGFDPSADSLHCGSLVPVMALAHLQRAGHRIVALVGGATGLIGDPTGKTELRNMLDEEQIQRNLEGLKEQLGRFVEFDEAGEKGVLVNNISWLGGVGYLSFLRSMGRHFTVNRMMAAKTYKDRFESENGLNFIEFNYMVLQAYDFLHLYQAEGCRLQMGGNDQWGNICAGVDLIRRVEGKNDAFAITFPLLTTSTGKKMGKTESGAVWLSADKLHPNEFYQYWRNTTDADTAKFLKLFSFLPLEEIEGLTAAGGKALNAAKARLAWEVTALTHGEEAAKRAQDAAQGGAKALRAVDVASSELAAEGLGVLAAFVRAGLAKSNGEARRLVRDGGAYVNDAKVGDANQCLGPDDFSDGGCVLRAGKKRRARLVIAG